ncbi:MAG TPA: hypothetical protein VHP59_22550, partial [Vineibacter terrae]|nr:hypothetical protein [Vineibacter terrae]
SPARTGPGTTNLPIRAAGVTVSPGDVIVGDADGEGLRWPFFRRRLPTDIRKVRDRWI